MKSIWEYLSANVDVEGDLQLDKQCIKLIREKFDEIHGDKDRDDDDEIDKSIKEIMHSLELVDDQLSFICVKYCVSESNDEDAALEIRNRFRKNGEILRLIPTAEPPPPLPVISKTSHKPRESIQQISEQKATSLNKIICIVHQKSTKSEVTEFLKDFLFRQVNHMSNLTTDPTTTHPICDGHIHPLNRGTLLDLFIRQQMDDRGTVTFMNAQTKYRLVEPISLTDEFESWTFDHFHSLLNFWLTIDANNQQEFPSPWTLNPDADFEYILVNRLISDSENSSSKQSDRPNTKSLENFIRDICRIESNGMFIKWYRVLHVEENIATYEHLTNLNQKEWDRISRLPMNALKTIKFYVDQEKQRVEERRPKTTRGETPTEGKSYSKSEILADLHMIKLYFIRQLEDEDGVEAIPRLEAKCVESAFDEMRAEGYEEDGLFDEMKLFFQPLTVTEEELFIDENDFEQVKEKQRAKASRLQKENEEFEESFRTKDPERQKLSDEIEKLRKERVDGFNRYLVESAATKRTAEVRNKLETDWSHEELRSKKKLNELCCNLNNKEQELQEIERKKLDNKNELEIIEKNLQSKKTSIDRRLVKAHRGFIMYGPPGTGKSVIMSKLARKIGIAMLGPPLAAGELERPLVGQSEAVILDLCRRGNRLPHLMCCVSIDEIDSLAPKRDEDSSEGKVAKISVLLSVIEGIKDVPNLMFFSATNRLHMMDEAFLRRMSGKFFVGRPSADARKRILDGIPRTVLKPHIRTKLAIATTNFSGAALKALASAITVHYISKKREEKRLTTKYVMKEEEALRLADLTARQYQLYLGLDTLPRLLLHNLDDQRQLSSTTTSMNPQKNRSVGFHLPEKCRFTGKIIISLHDGCVRIETIQSENKRHVIQQDLTRTEQNLQQLLERITSYGDDRNVQLLQLIDLNLLSSKGAYDEKKIFETLKERYDECMEYRRSMIVYDLDSLIGVGESESQSSMGTSVSTNLVNQSIYIYVTSRFREAKIEASRTDGGLTNERWAIAVARNPFLLKKFTADVDFMLTEQQINNEEEEHRRANEVLLCVKCRDHYVEDENKMSACTYHDGFVYDNLSLDLKHCTPSGAIETLNREEYIAFKEPARKEELEKKKARFKYICCHGGVTVGGGFNGCKKGKHGYGDPKKLNQRGEPIEKDAIKTWEQDCYNNIGYNRKIQDLLSTRETSLAAASPNPKSSN